MPTSTKSRVICVAGARPNFMKVAPVLRALSGSRHLESFLVHTGQHYDQGLSQVFFDDLGLPRPDVELSVGSASHAAQTAEVMRRFELVLEEQQPKAVVVVGDVNSTLACALATAKYQLHEPFPCRLGHRLRPVLAHIEAGLRSFDPNMPEEINRRATDSISDLLFASEPSGRVNLLREGVDPGSVFDVGNVMIDSLLIVKERAERSQILEDLRLREASYGVLTLHRPSNVDDLGEFARLVAVLDDITAELPLVFPIHPRTRSRLSDAGLKLEAPGWIPTEPLGYVDFVRLMGSARMVLTDSGGIQEETTVLGVPCITLRDTTERPVTVEEGTNILAGTSPTRVRAAFEECLGRDRTPRYPRLWDGRAGERIVEVLDRVLERR